MKGWYGFDLDGTLAFYTGWQGPQHIGEPVKLMLDKLKWHLAQGEECRIFTARIYPLAPISTETPDSLLESLAAGSDNRLASAALSALAIRRWCETHVGQVLTITTQKDYGMLFCYDDRAKQVIPNTGILVEARASQLEAELDQFNKMHELRIRYDTLLQAQNANGTFESFDALKPLFAKVAEEGKQFGISFDANPTLRWKTLRREPDTVAAASA